MKSKKQTKHIWNGFTCQGLAVKPKQIDFNGRKSTHRSPQNRIELIFRQSAILDLNINGEKALAVVVAPEARVPMVQPVNVSGGLTRTLGQLWARGDRIINTSYEKFDDYLCGKVLRSVLRTRAVKIARKSHGNWTILTADSTRVSGAKFYECLSFERWFV